jgi:two-component system sensor histidine kinase KdpD
MTDAGQKRGRLKIFLGYAAGAGKTYQMLEEAQQQKDKGVDVVIGYFEPHGRKDTIGKTEGLPFVPRRKLEYRGAVFEEMDTDAILRRAPQMCLVDEFAHTNVPGSERAKRWEDVVVLLDAGIDVLTTMNIQHLESLNDQVWRITGIRVRETVPDWVVKQADEVVMVDVTPRALLNRLARGVVYAPEKAAQALENFFKEANLVALREIALRQIAHEVDLRQMPVPGVTKPQPLSNERILVNVTPDTSTAVLLRRARRVADYIHAECLAVYVKRGSSRSARGTEQEAVDRHLNFARSLHIETRVVEGADPAEALVSFARANGVTQIFMARSRYKLVDRLAGKHLIHRVVRLASDLQITIVAT